MKRVIASIAEKASGKPVEDEAEAVDTVAVSVRDVCTSFVSLAVVLFLFAEQKNGDRPRAVVFCINSVQARSHSTVESRARDKVVLSEEQHCRLSSPVGG